MIGELLFFIFLLIFFAVAFACCSFIATLISSFGRRKDKFNYRPIIRASFTLFNKISSEKIFLAFLCIRSPCFRIRVPSLPVPPHFSLLSPSGHRIPSRRKYAARSGRNLPISGYSLPRRDECRTSVDLMRSSLHSSPWHTER